nr:putative ribonuclease H-like domain-containing protein [Tanacetum cinerariifolium]
MKAIFDELEAEVDQNVMNRKCEEIERKNLLIANDTLIENCLSKEVFYIATNSKLNVSRFSKMHDAHTVVQSRCLELETELSKLKEKIQKDDHDVIVKRFSNLEDGPDFDSVFEIKKLKDFIQGKDNAIRKLRMQISQLHETRSEADRTLDFRALDFKITQLTEKVSVLQEQNKLFRVENAKVKQHYKELYDSIMITHAKHIDQTTTLLTENENLKVQINAKLKCVTIDSVTPKVLVPGCSKHMTGDHSQLRNFMKKFIRTVRFKNNYFGAIIGYEDYVIGDSVISRVYYVEGLGHNMFCVGQFYDSDLEVAFRKHLCYVRDTDGVELIKEVVVTACYTQNRSLIHTRHNKTPYKLVHNKKPDLTFLRVFGALYYPTNDSEGLGKLQPKADIRIFYRTRSYIFDAWTNKFRARTKSGSRSTLCTPTNKDLEILFQPMFNEYLEPPHVDRPVSPAPAVLVPVNLAGVVVESTLIDENPFAPFDKDPFINIFAPEPTFASSSFGDASLANSTYEGIDFKESFAPVARIEAIGFLIANAASKNMTIYQMNVKTAFINGELKEEMYGLWYLKDTAIALTAYADVDMQFVKTHEEVEKRVVELFFVITNQLMDIFTKGLLRERFEFLLPRLVDLPYGKRAIGTKWVYKNKKDEKGIVVRNKARLVAQGHTQKEGINYEEVFAPVARIKAIILFLAYASFMGFLVYQMDVKSAFLYGSIEEEVYVCQPPGFEDPEYPDQVYKVVKVLYGLHQAPRACPV